MHKLNLGCGNRIADGWVNIDFHSSDSRVKCVNFLGGLPYPDNNFDVVYSSHVLEHFTREHANFLLGEAYRVIKPHGILRVVVPDLEGSCREYLRILAMPDTDPGKADKYEWIIIELLDQLVRSFPSGQMGIFYKKLRNSDDQELLSYVRSRTENTPLWTVPRKALLQISFVE